MSSAVLAAAAFHSALMACGARYPEVRATPANRIEATAAHESGFRLYAIRDNATGESLAPETLADARREVASRIAKGHRLDAGLMQVSSPNWTAYGLTLATLFDVEANVCAGARIYAQDYLIERRASCRYNSGSPSCSAYADAVERAEDRLSATPTSPSSAPSGCVRQMFVHVIDPDGVAGPDADDGVRLVPPGDPQCLK